MPLNTKLAEELRKKKGLTQAEAAESAGVAGGKQGWSNIIRGSGNVELSTLEAIADALGCNPCDLLVRPPTKGK